MHIPYETITAALRREDSDMKLCIHDAYSRPITYETEDGTGRGCGVISRLVGHTASGDVMTIDIVFESEVSVNYAERLFNSVLDLPEVSGTSIPDTREEGS